jgi:hypothetical protein
VVANRSTSSFSWISFTLGALVGAVVTLFFCGALLVVHNVVALSEFSHAHRASDTAMICLPVALCTGCIAWYVVSSFLPRDDDVAELSSSSKICIGVFVSLFAGIACSGWGF